MSKYKCVALLPMKANSERVKGKNFRDFAGKPLFRWILVTLLAVPEIDLVVINTDAESNLIESGLEKNDRVLIRQRKPEICGDLVSMNLVLADDVEAIDSEKYIMTHTTNPLLKSETLKKGLETYEKGLSEGKDSLFSVTKIQTRFYKEDASPVNHDPDNLVRTQDLEPWFEENSNFYIFNRSGFAATKARIGKAPKLFPMDPLEAIDIDDQSDWDLAELIKKNLL